MCLNLFVMTKGFSMTISVGAATDWGEGVLVLMPKRCKAMAYSVRFRPIRLAWSRCGEGVESSHKPILLLDQLPLSNE